MADDINDNIEMNGSGYNITHDHPVDVNAILIKSMNKKGK